MTIPQLMVLAGQRADLLVDQTAANATIFVVIHSPPEHGLKASK